MIVMTGKRARYAGVLWVSATSVVSNIALKDIVIKEIVSATRSILYPNE